MKRKTTKRKQGRPIPTQFSNHLLPPLYRRIMDRVAADDQAWFADHQDETERIRAYVEGEFAPDKPNPAITIVRVTRVPGRGRVREALIARDDPTSIDGRTPAEWLLWMLETGALACVYAPEAEITTALKNWMIEGDPPRA